MYVITVGIRVDHVDGGHVHFALFVGPDGGRGNAGDLVLRVDEFWWFVDRLPGVVLTGEEVARHGDGAVMTTPTTVEITEYDAGYEVSVEMNDGDILTATGATLADALRALADRVEAHP